MPFVTMDTGGYGSRLALRLAGTTMVVGLPQGHSIASSLRTQGPITTDVHVTARWSRQRVENKHRRLWVPTLLRATLKWWKAVGVRRLDRPLASSLRKQGDGVTFE